jgi:hypothetical protein
MLMAEARNRMDNPSPDVLFQEIYLPDDQDFSTGTFRIRIKQNALITPAEPGPKAISSLALIAPRFQISVSVNPGTREIPVLLGRADGSDPIAVAFFFLPPELDTSLLHDFEVTFEDWQVISLTMDGAALRRSAATQTRPPSVAGVIKAKEGEPMSIPRLGPQSPRAFTVEEQKRVITAIDFELPFALEGLEGRLPLTVLLRQDVPGDVGIRTRQRHPDEIARSLGLAHILPPTSGVIVATGDPHGRINVSTLQFQFRGFVDLTNRGEVLEQCLDSANRIIECYRMAKHDFRVRKVAKTDILFYGARHFLDGQVFNDCYDPVAAVILVKAQHFPCDPMLMDALWFSYARSADLWERLMAEARHFLAVGEHRLAVVTAFTALELVLMRSNGKNLKAFCARGGLRVDPLPIPGSRKSVIDCLEFLNGHNTELRLDLGLAGRMLSHYNKRNLIVHRGMMRIAEDQARECVQDTYLLIRHVFEILHLSVVAQVEIVSLPPSNAAFPVMRVEGPEWGVVIWCASESLNASLTKQQTGEQVCVGIPWQNLNWAPGQRAAILLTYNAWTGETKLAFNGPESVGRSECSMGSIDATLVRSYSIEMPEEIMRPVSPGSCLVWPRVVEPEQLVLLGSLFIPISDETSDASEEDC